MKQEIVEVFDQIIMPESCEQNIRQAAKKNEPKRLLYRKHLRKAMTALAGCLMVLFVLSPQVRAAVSSWVVRYVFPESGITIYEETTVDGEVVRIMAVDTEQPAFARYEDGRLYFTGNGQNRDITQEITPEKPFIYSYSDEYGLTHYMVVGYSDSMENFGIYEFIREVQEGQQPWEGWSNGYGRNFLDPETEIRYPWVDIVWQQLEIPWPMPEE